MSRYWTCDKHDALVKEGADCKQCSAPASTPSQELYDALCAALDRVNQHDNGSGLTVPIQGWSAVPVPDMPMSPNPRTPYGHSPAYNLPKAVNEGGPK